MSRNVERLVLLARSFVVGVACYLAAIGWLPSSSALAICVTAVVVQVAAVRSINSASWGVMVVVAVFVASSMPFTDPAAAGLVGTVLFVEALRIGAPSRRRPAV